MLANLILLSVSLKIRIIIMPVWCRKKYFIENFRINLWHFHTKFRIRNSNALLVIVIKPDAKWKIDTASILCYGPAAPSGPGLSYCRGCTITLRHTTLGRTPLDEWSARRRHYLCSHYKAVHYTKLFARKSALYSRFASMKLTSVASHKFVRPPCCYYLLQGNNSHTELQ